MAFWQKVNENRKKVYLYGSGGIVSLIIFLSLLSAYGVNISISGDILCNGTAPYTCTSYINISTTNYSIRMPSTIFSIEGNTSYILYKKSLSGSWLKYNLSGKTITTDSKMELKLVGTKNSNETVTIKVNTGGRNAEVKWYGLSAKNETTDWIKYKKSADYSGVILIAKPIEKCSYKPDGQNDGYKICNSTVQIENTLPVTISLSNPKIDINVKTKSKIYYKNPLTLNPFEKANISINYEIKQYSKASYNFSIKASGFDINLDPDVTGCGYLGSPNATYTLTQSISDPDVCLIINATNVTLNCNFYTITYQTATTTPGSGVQLSGTRDNTTIQNCTLTASLYYSGSLGAVNDAGASKRTNISYNTMNVWASTEGGGIHFDSATDFEVFNNNITGKTGSESVRMVEIRQINSGIFRKNNITKAGMYNGGNFIIDSNGLSNLTFEDNYFDILNVYPTYGEGRGLHFSQGNLTLNRDTIKVNGSYSGYEKNYGLRVSGPSNVTITNSVFNITANNSVGIEVASGTFNIINTTIYVKESICQDTNSYFTWLPAGIVFKAGSVNISNSTIKTYKAHAYSLQGGNHKIIDSKILYDADCKDAIIVYTGGTLELINTTYNYSEPKSINFTSSATGQVQRSWYFDATVNDTSGNLINLARVTIVNKTNGIIFNELTGTNGKIDPKSIITEMLKNRTNEVFYNNHTINATKAGYGTDIIVTLNITNNTVQNFTLTPLFFVNIKNPINTTYNTNALTFNVSLSLAGTDCWYNLNNTGNISMDELNSTWFNKDVTNIPEGSHNVTFICNSTTNVFNQTNSTLFSVEYLLPVVSIISPLNSSYNVNQLDFNVSVNISTSWCGFNLDNAGNVTMTKINSTYFNYTKTSISDGSHTINFTCNSTINKYNSTGDRIFFTDITNPAINLLSPANASEAEPSVTFSCNATNTELKNISLIIWNSTGTFFQRNDTNISGTSYSASFQHILSSLYSTYKWACKVCDTTNHCNQTGNRTLTLRYVDFNISIYNASYIDFYPNSTTINGSIVNGTEAFNQTPQKGILLYENNLSYKINITAKLNETKYPWLYMHLGGTSSYSNSVILNTSYQNIVLNVLVNNFSYLWMWQDYYNWGLPNGSWYPELSISGEVVS